MIRASMHFFTAATVVSLATLLNPARADGATPAPQVNWIINQNSSSLTFSGATYVGTPFPFKEVTPGSLTTSLSGYFSTNNSFTTNLIFGNGTVPSYPGKPGDSSQYSTWADGTLPASAAAQNHVNAVNNGSYQPTFPLPSVPIPISPLPSDAGPSTPASFAGLMLDDQTDPANPVFSPFAFRNYSQTFFTNTTDSTNSDPLFPAYMANGATVNADGTFSSAAVGSGVVAFWDAYVPDFLGGALTGRSPVTEVIKNFSAIPGVIGRDGAAYTISFTDEAIKYLVGKTAPSTLDLEAHQLLNVHATANLKPGDANFDGIVNSQDLALISSNWLATNAFHLGGGDVNGDGIVNSQDLALVSSNWLGTTPPLPGSGNASAVPEPSSIVLAGMVGFGCVCRFLVTRRRRVPG
jgi:hypothetical protein